MRPQYTNYIILEHQYCAVLSKSVNAYLSKGYVLLGGVIVAVEGKFTVTYCQALALPAPKESLKLFKGFE